MEELQSVLADGRGGELGLRGDVSPTAGGGVVRAASPVLECAGVLVAQLAV